MKIYFLWVIFLFNSTFAYLTENNDTIAIIGKTSISGDEFLQRYEFTPWPRSKFDDSIEAFKKEFLNTLIAEKLWALQAERLGFDTTESMKNTFRLLEKMYVRDALYKAEILDKVAIPDSLLADGYKKIQFILKVNYKVFVNKEDAGKVYQTLKKGFPFDYVSKELADISKDSTVEVTFGQMDEGIEEILFSMNPGEYTAPIQSQNQWYIFQLAGKKDNPITNAELQDKAEKQVKSTIQSRLVQKRYDEFFRSFFSGRRINANGIILRSISEKIYNKLTQKLKINSAKDKIYFNSSDFTDIEKQFAPDSLNIEFIQLDNNPVSIRQFLRALAFDEFSLGPVSRSEVLKHLNARVKSYIEKELLAQEGYKRDLQNLPEVKNEIKMWREYYLSQLYKKQFVERISVSEEEIRNYYNTRYTSGQSVPEVNIVEILTDSLEVIENVLNKLKDNTDIRELARQYTKRESMREKSGEFGFFPVTMYGEIGKIAGNLQIGEVYGPLSVPEGYSIFKVIGKRNENKIQLKSFEESKDEIRKNLASFKLNREVVNRTVQLAKEFGIKINEGALRSVKVNNITMFVYKYMGFGGRITSVPLIIPFTDWVEQWEKSKTDMP